MNPQQPRQPLPPGGGFSNMQQPSQQVTRPTGGYQQQSQQMHPQQQQQQQHGMPPQQQQGISPQQQQQLQPPGTPVPPQMPQHQQHQYQQPTMPQQPQMGMVPQQQPQMRQTQPQEPMQQAQQEPMQQGGALGTPTGNSDLDGSDVAGAALSHAPAALGNRIKGIFQKDKPQGPNFGFTPTAAMAQRHEDSLVSSKRPFFQFQVTKLRNWRTGYVRLLCFYDDHVSTVDPETHNPTNTWNYSTLMDFGAVPDKDQIALQFDKDKLKFQCHNVDKSQVLTALLECQDRGKTPEKANIPMSAGPLVLCNRWTRQGLQTPSGLRMTPYALVEVHPGTKQRLQTYRYVDIVAISFTSDDPAGLILHFHSKSTTRLFSIGNHQNARSELVTAMRQAYQRMGLELRMTESMTVVQWKQSRREKASLYRQMTIATEYSVTKESRRHNAAIVGSGGWAGGVVSRTLCLTGHGLILEKDPSDGSVVSTRPVKELCGIVRPASEGVKVRLEYSDGQTREYSSSSRDSLIVSILDSAATLGRNPQVHVSDVSSGGYNLASFAKASALEKSGGLFQPISIPLHCLKRVHTVATAAFSYLNSNTESSTEEGQPANPIEECRNVMELCREFNASVLPTAEGLPTADKDKYVLGSIGALWGLVAELLELQQERHLAEQTAAPMFQTLHRLSKTVAGYKHCIELATFTDCLPLLWTIEDAFCKFWAFRALTVVLSGNPRKRNKEVEYVNKSVIFKAGGPQLVKGLVSSLLNEKVSDLIRMVMSDILQSVLCSFADTTSPEHFAALIQALGENYQALLNTLYQQTPFVIENSALLLHLLSTHAPSVATGIREAALSSAILLHHLHAAIFSPLEGQRFLSRFLCSLWLAGPMDCDEKKLLRRIVPRGFMNFLKMPALSQVEEEQLDELDRDAVEENIPEDSQGETTTPTISSSSPQSGAAGTNTARLRSRIALARAIHGQDQQQQTAPENFRIFFHVLTQNHSLPDLIWNQQTRRELRIGLESEIQYIQRETEARGINQIAWNYQQFGIEYASLENELRVGSVYMRLWLQAGEGFIKSWDEPLRLFELLFRRFLCEMDRNTKITVMCIRCLERLYAIHGTTIGAFPDVMILIRSMASTRSTETQHRLLGLLATILGVQKDETGEESFINVPENAEQLLNTESIEQLCQFVAWGQTNGVQVGNLMTNVLVPSNSGRAMLTDGSEMRPDGDGSNPTEPQEAAVDATCPPVWFIASTGRIPPPPESIRGPFRVSKLREMMEKSDISPFTLVTSTNVDSYDDDDDIDRSDNVKEEQIDTGKWRRLDQVWQLRWQLCTDGSGTGIFKPSEVALRAIRSLTRLVDLHKSLDFRGLPYYPIPIAKRIMCGLSRDPFKKTLVDVSAEHQESFLSILSQSILCNDPQVVDKAASLLLKLTQHNEAATAKFYLTGVYYFIVSYTGSNFKSLAKLLHSTHLKQHFRSGFAAAADKTELPLKERSILGSLLPEGVLFILLNYGVDRFNEIFVGNFDTPEVIWNLEMRKHLIEMVRQHLGDFPKRLWQNTTTKYEYCPMPGVAYKRLEREIFCHNYYLHNLCDEARFPDWPIAEPVEVFRACLEEFKRQVSRNETEEGEAIKNATKVLALKPGDGSKELRKAYRSLARMYHPDKNPAGREMFESIQAAYELLLPLVESGQPIEALSGGIEGSGSSENDAMDVASTEGFVGGMLQMKAMQLLIRTQALICRRFEQEMSKYKYPAYQILLICLKMTMSSRRARDSGDPAELLKSTMMTKKRAEFVRDIVELVFRTCLVSPLNAEELVLESGVLVLDELFDFYTQAAHCIDQSPNPSISTASGEVVAQILVNIIHTLAGVAYYESGRTAIAGLSGRSRFCINWRRCLDGHFLGDRIKEAGDTLIKRYALEGIAHMTKNRQLQEDLIGCGVVWPLVQYLLGFDPTLDDVAISRDSLDDDVGVSQAASNIQARLSARALGMLCGVLQDGDLLSPKNQALQKAMDALLTQPIALFLRNKRTTEILKTLNANVETPSRIWNVQMRTDLGKFIQRMISERPERSVQTVEDELRQTAQFEYPALRNELRVGGVYIRLFNQLGLEKAATREIQNPAAFAKQLLGFVANCINYSADLPAGWISLTLPVEDTDKVLGSFQVIPVADRRFVQVITALRILVRVDGLIDDLLCQNTTGAAPILLSLLELSQDTEAFEIGCDILTILSPKQHFADAVAGQGALWRLLWVLERSDSSGDMGDTTSTKQSEMLRKQRGWMLLESLSSSPSIASSIVASTAWVELLGILVGYSRFTKIWIARTGSAKTLSRLLWDPKTGPVVAPLLQRFLPATLVVVLKEEGPDKMLNLFDGESDTPELIWESSMRGELRRVIGQILDECTEERRQAGVGDDVFELDPTTRVKYKNLEDELFIGGVYVSKFLKEPTYNVRDPTRFLESLMQRWVHELQLSTSTNRVVGSDLEAPTTLVVGGEDALQSVTNASVYLCKVRSNLCDKLSQWGYMSRCLCFLQEVIDRELLGTPLLSVIRILHVAVNRRSNVDALIMSGKNDSLNGIVPFSMRALDSNGLHKDAAFMMEMVKKLFTDALGDLKKAMPPDSQMSDQSLAYATAPSPAPGEGPVSRNRVTMGNPLDDPLATTSSPLPRNPLLIPSGPGGMYTPVSNAPQMVGNQGYSGSTMADHQAGGSRIDSRGSLAGSLPYQSGVNHQGNFQNFQNQGAYQTAAQAVYTPPYQQHIQSNSNGGQTQQMYGFPQRTAIQQQSQQNPLYSSNVYPTGEQMHRDVRTTPFGQLQSNTGNMPHGTMQQSGYATSPPPPQHQQIPQQSGLHQNGYYPISSQQSSRSQQPPQQTSNMQQAYQHPTQGQPSASSAQTRQAPRQVFQGISGLQQQHQHQQQQQNQQQKHQQIQTPYSSASATNGSPGMEQSRPQNQDGLHQRNGTQFASPGHQPRPGDNPTQNTANVQMLSDQRLAGGSSVAPVATGVSGWNGIPQPLSNNQNVVRGQNTAPVLQGSNGPTAQQRGVNQGSGLDARTALDPEEEAERRIKTSAPAPGAADGRVALLQSAIVCGLPKFVIEQVLENPELASIRDPAAAKVHAVELLKLLMQDPGFGMKFKLILDDIPGWKKYKNQDHSLFITGPEQKTDYFLTDGSNGEPTKMLTQG